MPGAAGCGRRAYPTRDPVALAQTDGSVEVSGSFNQCPDESLDVSPSEGKLDQPFTISGSASDVDGDHLTISLQADSGSFSDAHALPATFTCSRPGPVAITLTVSDGSCPTMKSVSIFCLGTHPVDGGGDAAIGMDAAGGAGGSRGGTGGGSGGMPGAGTGGAGMIVNHCPDEPTSGGAACATCTTDNCNLGPSPDGTDGCCALASAADQRLCEAAVACFSTGGCTVSGDAAKCFCGNSGGTCYSIPGAANGPCVAQVFAAAKTTTLTTVRSVFTSSVSPLGRAVSLLGCWGATCATECAIP